MYIPHYSQENMLQIKKVFYVNFCVLFLYYMLIEICNANLAGQSE